MALSRRVLIIDEDIGFRRSATQALSGMGFQVVEAGSARAGLNEIHHFTPDCVLLDLSTTDIPAEQVLRTMAIEAAPRAPVVIVGDKIGLDAAVTAMKLGAKDVLTKPVDGERIKAAVVAAMEKSELARDVARLETLLGASAQDAFVSESPSMSALVEKIDRLANVEMPVLILGEKGSGKGSIARRLHASGSRAQKPFVIVPESDNPLVVEQALFGGSGRPSAFAQAGDGVLFIESIASLGPAGQERLAKVLAELSAARTGGQPVSWPRLIVAAERELSAMVEAGQLKDDLARRLSPLTVQMPSLRERKNDIPRLIEQIAQRVARQSRSQVVAFGADVIAFFCEQSWPGNLRELEAAVLRAIALSRGGQVRLEDLSEPRAAVATLQAAPQRGWAPQLDAQGEVLSYDTYEAEIFRFALDRAGGCVSRAAEMLGVGRATMYRKMRSYEIDAPPVSERAIVRTGRRRQADEAEEVVAAPVVSVASNQAA